VTCNTQLNIFFGKKYLLPPTFSTNIYFLVKSGIKKPQNNRMKSPSEYLLIMLMEMEIMDDLN
jgi:hypothetical protein